MKKILFTSFLLLGTSAFSKGGDGAGNGGGFWLCKNKDNSIRKMELVDFYEAKQEFKLKIQEYPGLSSIAILQKYKAKIQEINPRLYNGLSPYFENLMTKLEPLDSALEIIDDTLFRVVPSEKWCKDGEATYLQMANFTDYGKILLDNDHFTSEKLNELNRAGLYLHEVVYEYLREKHGDINSVRARKIVGIVSSTLGKKACIERLEKLFGNKNLILQMF